VYVSVPSNQRVRKIDTHGKITTFAGTGKRGYSGDGGPARKARLHIPYGIAMDRHDNLYIADYRNLRVRKIDTRTGTITTVAGTGKYQNLFGPNGDGGPATQAPLHAPESLAVDAHDNLYISGGGCVVRKVDADGIISTVVGPVREGVVGACGFSGDGGPASQARVGVVGAMVADSAGNLYLSDGQNYRIRKISADGIISTFAGNGKAGFSGDGRRATKAKLDVITGLAVDGKDNVFIATGRRVRKVDTSGIISTAAGTGPRNRIARDGDRARKMGDWGPLQIAVKRNGDMLIPDHSYSRVWIIYRIAAPTP
jgi:DNA-binding beta-propeller fold protein YncE